MERQLNFVLVGGVADDILTPIQVDVKGSVIVTLNDDQVQTIVNQILDALRAKE